MPYCPNCGAELNVNAQYCPKCGTPQSTGQYRPQQYHRPADPNDSGSIGWFILGFLVEIAGLILYLVWINDRPKSAKMAGLGALTGLIVSIVFGIVYFIALFSLSVNQSIIF